MAKVAKILRDFFIDEISPVDHMAQEPAEMVLMKRDGTNDPADGTEADGDPVEKRVYLTSITRGHQHLVDTTTPYDQRTSYDVAQGEDQGHSHPFVTQLDGSIAVGTVDGHTHEILDDDSLQVMIGAEAAKRAFSAEERKRLADKGLALPDGSYPIVTTGDLKNAIRAFGRAGNKASVARHIKKRARALGATDLLPDEGLLALSQAEPGAGEDDTDLDKEARQMPDPKKPEKGEVQKADKGGDVSAEIAELNKKLERATALAELNDAEKAFYKGLKKDEQAIFLKADAAGRAKELAKAKADDPVVYTDTEGQEYRKSDDQRVVALAKRADQDRQLAKKEREQRVQLELEKRAKDEIPFLPGEISTKMAILSSLEKIDDPELRKSALESLKAQNQEMALAFERKGVRPPAGGGSESAEDQLNKKAEALAKEKGIDVNKAYNEVLETPEGKELYKAYLAEHPAQNRPLVA